MSSRFAIFLAVTLLIGAVIFAFLAWQLSQTTPSVALVEPEPVTEPEEIVAEPAGYPVVFARERIPPEEAITHDQLETFLLPVQPPDTYSMSEDLIGKRSWRSIAAGEMVRPGHLRIGSRLATTIYPHERAVAISVDEVIGSGGFLSPGDKVDVLLYLRDAPRGGYPSAQVVLQDVRLLSFAERVQPLPETAQVEDEDERTEFRGVTAVLAVSEQQVTRLMLASSAGTLRLALRSALALKTPEDDVSEPLSGTRAAGDGQQKPELEDFSRIISLDELLPEPPGREVQAAEPSPPPPPRPRIAIHRGVSLEEVELEP